MKTRAGCRYASGSARFGGSTPRWTSLLLVVAMGLGGCGREEEPVEDGALRVVAQSRHRPADPATHLAVIVQPRGGSSGELLATQPQVEIRSRRGMRVLGATTPVHVTLVGHGALSGTTTVRAVDGVAAFTDLVVTGAGPMWLRFASPGLRGATSRAFRVAPSCDLAWRWQNPLTRGNSLTAVWGSAANDVWAVGEAGVIVHWDGSRWTLVPSGATNSLHGVWGSAADDVWAVGEAGLLHWDGATWSTYAVEPPGSLNGIWGSGANDVWVVGDGGRILHWQGSSWEPVPSGTLGGLSAVGGTGPDDVWAVGDELLRWDGSAWSAAPSGAPPPLEGPWISVWAGGGAVWVGGASSLWRWDGVAWSSWFFGRPTYGIWGSGPGDVWFAMETIPPPEADASLTHWNGSEFSFAGAPNTKLLSFRAVWGSGPDDVWAVGDGGAILHGDGTHFTSSYETTSLLTEVRGDGRELWVSGVGGDEFLDDGTILRSAGAGWEQTPVTAWVFDVWPSTPLDAWAVGTSSPYDRNGRILHWDGAAWTDTGAAVAAWLYGVWGAAADDVWAVGGAGGFLDPTTPGVSLHWNGVAWSEVPTGTSQPLYGVGGHGRDVWTVGGAGTALRWRSGAWSPVSTGTTRTLRRVWSGARDDAWAVGEAGTVLRWNGSSWVTLAAPTAADLNGVWGRAANDVWIVGAGILLHWDGAAWAAFPGVTSRELTGVWGRGPRDVWAVGAGATILHYSCGP